MPGSYLIQKLKLTNFKVYDTIALDLMPGINIITGQNGVGKTSILDGIRLLVFGKSYFGASDKSNLKHQTDFMRAEARVLRNDDSVHGLVVKLEMGKPKSIELDGKKIAKLSDFVGRFLSVCVSPDDIVLVHGQSKDRRTFIDQVIVQFDKKYTQHLGQYNKALKQRNTLLKQFLKKQYYDPQLLEAFEKVMIESAPYVHQARMDFVEEFKTFFQSAYEDIAPEKEKVELKYDSKLSSKSMENLLDEYRDRDRYSGRCNVGIHKDELNMLLNDNDLKTYGSQGQVKSFVFALKIAQFKYFVSRTDQIPIMLLDDMFDKLDSSRVEKILFHLNEKWGTQILITDTDKDRISSFLKSSQKPFHQIHISEQQKIEVIS